MIATASVYLAGRIVAEGEEGDPFPPNLRRHSGLTEKAVKPCAAALLLLAQKAHVNTLQAVYKKYGHSKFSEVAKVQIPSLEF
jgi:Cyclin, C-terminal domain